jgi:ketosteroid isomerase-like protein
MSENLELVRTVYERFGAGDVAGVLALWNDALDCQSCMGLSVGQFPIAGPRQGKPGLEALLADYARALEYDIYEARDFHEDGDTFFVLGHCVGTFKATGKHFATGWAHVFRLEGGKVSAFQEYCDTAAMVAAARP